MIGTAVNAVARPIDLMAAASGFTVKFFNRLSTKFHRFAKNLRQPLIYFCIQSRQRPAVDFHHARENSRKYNKNNQFMVFMCRQPYVNLG